MTTFFKRLAWSLWGRRRWERNLRRLVKEVYTPVIEDLVFRVAMEDFPRFGGDVTQKEVQDYINEAHDRAMEGADCSAD